MFCEECESESVIKNGKSRHGKQRYLCSDCGRTFGLGSRKKIDEGIKRRALHLYLAGMSFRKIARFLGVSHTVVIYWARKWQSYLPKPAKHDGVAEITCSILIAKVDHQQINLCSDDILLALPNPPHYANSSRGLKSKADTNTELAKVKKSAWLILGAHK